MLDLILFREDKFLLTRYFLTFKIPSLQTISKRSASYYNTIRLNVKIFPGPRRGLGCFTDREGVQVEFLHFALEKFVDALFRLEGESFINDVHWWFALNLVCLQFRIRRFNVFTTY